MCLIHCIIALNRGPTDAGLLGVITSDNVGKYWTELALALGIPNAMIEDSGATERVHTLKYWRNQARTQASQKGGYIFSPVHIHL